MPNRYKSTFLSQAEPLLPNLISHNRIIDEEPLDNYYEIVFQTKKPYTIDEVIDMFENDAHLHILYHHTINDSIQEMESCCAFSHPTGEQMYKYNVSTRLGGIVTEICVSIYYSLEHLTSELDGELQGRRNSGGRFLVAMDPAEIYRIALLIGR